MRVIVHVRVCAFVPWCVLRPFGVLLCGCPLPMGGSRKTFSLENTGHTTTWRIRCNGAHANKPGHADHQPLRGLCDEAAAIY